MEKGRIGGRAGDKSSNDSGVGCVTVTANATWDNISYGSETSVSLQIFNWYGD